MFTSILLAAAVFVAAGVLMEAIRLYGAAVLIKAVRLPFLFVRFIRSYRRVQVRIVPPPALPGAKHR